MKFLSKTSFRPLYLLLALQAIIILLVLGNWLISRNNAYNKIFAPDEYILSETAVLETSVSTDSTKSTGGTLLTTSPIDLARGSYQVNIHYSADQGGNTISASSDPVTQELIYSTLTLNPEMHMATLTLDLAYSCKQVSLSADFSGSGYLAIHSISIHETSGIHKQNLFHAILLCLFLNFIYYFKISGTDTRKIILTLSGLFLVSCYPLYLDYLIVGHDIPFHLLRIEGIAEGLKAGTFPVKIHPLWAKGNGYAAGIFYGDTFLYFPALLRLMGFSVQTAYKYFVAAINLGTILISYYSFKTIFSSQKIGLLGSIVYTMSLYRLADTYTRAAVGEYSAMMCFPLILCGFYLIFTKADKQSWWKYASLTALGLTGVIQSHVLSCLMIVFVVVILCIILIRKVFQRYTFLSLSTAALVTLCLNLGFIVPFLDFYREDIMINSAAWTGNSSIVSFQGSALFPAQLFSFFANSNGGSWHTISGLSTEATYSLGIVLTFGLGLSIYLLCIHRKTYAADKNYRATLLGLGIGCLLLFMCTCYFPWDAITSGNEILQKIIYTLQFPWRLLAPATLLLTFTLCCSFSLIERSLSNLYVPLLLAVCMLLTVNCGWYFYDFVYTASPYRVYNTHDLNTMAMYSYEYLPAGTDPNAIVADRFASDGVYMETYQREGTTIYLTANTHPDGGYIELPLTYYKYYRCIDAATSEQYSVGAGQNQVVKVYLPGNYSGTLKVSFVEPWFWRVSEVISALSLVAIVIMLLKDRFPTLLQTLKARQKNCAKNLENFVDKQ